MKNDPIGLKYFIVGSIQRYIQALRKMVPNVTKPSALQSAYAMCDGESDTDMINGGTWSTIATTQDSAQQRFK